MRMTFQETTPLDIDHLSRHLRKADLEELQAAGCEDILSALTESWHTSRLCYAAYIGTQLVSVFGVSGVKGGPGLIWCLGTDAVERFPVEFVRAGKVWFKLFHDDHDVLWNWIDTRNRVHVNWLKYMGCEFLEKVQLPSGVHFQRFTHLDTRIHKRCAGQR